MADELRCVECGRMSTTEEETPSPTAHGWELVVDAKDLNIVFALCPDHAGGRDQLPRVAGERPTGPPTLMPWRPSG